MTSPPERILVIALSGIGDTLIATPFIRELRLNFPQAEIDALVFWPGARQLLENNPHLNSIYQHDFLRRSRRETLQLIHRLRGRRYDLSFNVHTQGRREYRIVARAVNARRRLSHAYENHGWWDSWLVTDSLPQDYTVHCAVNNNRLLALVGAAPRLTQHSYDLFLTGEEHTFATDYLSTSGLGNHRLLGIHVGSGGTKNLALRRWPLGNYVELIRAVLKSRPDVRVLLFGGPEEQEAHREIQSAIAHGIHLPQTPTLRKAAALVAHCHTFLSVDTVFMHLAAAVQVPRQLVIETPTVNPPILPLRADWKLIPNPGVAGRNLEYYQYDGRPIAGTPETIQGLMRTVTVDTVLQAVLTEMDRAEGSRG